MKKTKLSKKEKKITSEVFSFFSFFLLIFIFDGPAYKFLFDERASEMSRTWLSSPLHSSVPHLLVTSSTAVPNEPNVPNY